MQSRETLENQYQEQVVQGNEFYRDRYDTLIIFLVIALFILLGVVGWVMYQVYHRPLPVFRAISSDGQQMGLSSYDEPNLLPDTLLKWASKAAVAAYTFDFVNYKAQIEAAHPYFTDSGWRDYQNSIAKLIETVIKNQLIVNSVVAGPPVISNQGDLPTLGYAWRVQMPFLVTYQSSDTTSPKSFMVLMTIVKVPTWKNKDAIGIDQFVMQ